MAANGNGKNNGDFSFGNVNAAAGNGMTKIQTHKKQKEVCHDDSGPTVKAQTIDELHSLQRKKSAPTTPIKGTQGVFAEQERQTKIQTHKKQKEVCHDGSGPTVKAQTIDELHSLQRKKSAPTTPIKGTQGVFAEERQKQQLQSISFSNAFLDSSPAPHTVYGYVSGLLLTLVGIKNQGSGNNIFKEHVPTIVLFLIALLIYVIALTHQKFYPENVKKSPILSFCLCHISGALSCELLVLLLVPPIWCFLVNLSLALVVLLLVFFYHHHVCSASFFQGTHSSSDGQQHPDVV